MAEQKTCRQCNAQFTVEDEDLAFYKKISPTFAGKTFEIPSPTLCPQCRRQRRLACRNVGKIYARTSDLSGKQIVSCLAPNSKFKVYHLDEWLSDKFDPYKYGRDFDFSRPFFEQLHELSLEVPWAHMDATNNENSEYTNNTSDCKNCYLVENSTEAEDSFYSLGLFYSKDCVDCYKTFRCESCYECINIESCYNCYFCKDTINCSESILLDSCVGCQNCYGCSNLSNKQYWIFNEPKTKEEFLQAKDKFLSASYLEREQLISEGEKFNKNQPKKFAHFGSSENITGDYIYHSKNVTKSYIVDNCENIKYSTNISYANDLVDVDYWGDHSQQCFECAEIGTQASNIQFSRNVYSDVSNIYYSLSCCLGCHDVFGCVCMKHAEYCVLNKKYSKQEYEELVARIIGHMQQTGEWGEFFPMSMSQFAYNETAAMDYFPLEKDEAIKIGAYWQDENYDQTRGNATRELEDIMVYTDQTKAQELLSSVLVCKQTGRPYKIQGQELAFYLRNHIQIPLHHPNLRYQRRFRQINPQTIYHRSCQCEQANHGHNGKCANEFETTYAPDRKERVFCEDCYQKSIL